MPSQSSTSASSENFLEVLFAGMASKFEALVAQELDRARDNIISEYQQCLAAAVKENPWEESTQENPWDKSTQDQSKVPEMKVVDVDDADGRQVDFKLQPSDDYGRISEDEASLFVQSQASLDYARFPRGDSSESSEAEDAEPENHSGSKESVLEPVPLEEQKKPEKSKFSSAPKGSGASNKLKTAVSFKDVLPDSSDVPPTRTVSLPSSSFAHSGTTFTLNCPIGRQMTGSSVGSKMGAQSRSSSMGTRSQPHAPVGKLHSALLEHADSDVMVEKLDMFVSNRASRRPSVEGKASVRIAYVRGHTMNLALSWKSSMWRKCHNLTHKWKPKVLDPSSPRRIWWDGLGALLIVYDMIFIPLTFFEIPRTQFFIFMQWLCFIFWTCDIPSTFFVAVHVKGILDFRLKVTARKYLRTFFGLDVLIVAMDGSVVLMDLVSGEETDSDAVGVMRSYRMVRMLRVLRLIRVVKLRNNLASLMQHIHSERATVTLGILKLTLGILTLNHLIACLWYAICKWGAAPQTWLNRIGDDRENDIAYLYMTSLHWSLTQFTPAAMEVYPAALHERTFAVVVIVFALVTFSSFISSITNAMDSLRNLNRESNQEHNTLQLYFRTHSISLSLCARVTRYVQYKQIQHDLSVTEKDVKLLQLLSLPLQIDLHYEVHRERLQIHGFFCEFDKHFQRCMKMICHKAVEEIHVSEGDHLFCSGDLAKHFLIMRAGSISYSHGTMGQTALKQGQWLAEAGLWTRWSHKGKAQATTETTLDAVDYAQFVTCLVDSHAADDGCPVHYAHLFVEHLKTISLDDLSDLPDETFKLELAITIAFFEVIDEECTGSMGTLNSNGSEGSSDSRRLRWSRRSSDSSGQNGQTGSPYGSSEDSTKKIKRVSTTGW